MAMSNPILSWRRVRALCVKETRQIVRDPSSWLIAVVIPLLLLFIFGYGINLDSSKLRVGILLEQRSEAALDFTHTMTGSPYIDATISDNRQELIAKMQAGKIRGLVVIPVDFAEQMERANAIAPIQVITDGRNSNSAQIAANYLQQIVKNYQQELLEGKPKPNNSELVVRNWYNPNLDYKWFVVPSLIAMITTIGVMIVTSLSVAREREQGTLDQLLVSPLTTWQIFIGKAVPALIVATFQATIVLAIGIWAYQIPFAGSLALFYFTMVIYGLSLVGFGLLISSLCSTQQQAFIGVFVFMMPAILLSGYVSPVENMPVWLQNLTWINPIRHFTDITKQIYLKDASLDIVWNSLWPLLVITATTGSAAYAMFRRKVM
ncbi:TPA: ABC transporter permease [Escherichia coli]